MDKEQPNKEIEMLQKAVDTAKKQNELLNKRDAEEAKKKELRKQLRHYQVANNPVARNAKKLGSGLGRALDNIEINREREKSGCVLGDTVMITNGSYTGKEMKIEQFILGGILGHVNGQEIRIRHGSYYKEIEDA